MSKPDLLINLQFLRFAAALVVVVFHASGQVDNVTGGASWISPVRGFGFAAVDVFFVISGFVMWHTNREGPTWSGPWRFLYQRLARVFIGYWLFLALALLGMWLWVPETIGSYRWLRSVFLMTQPEQQPIQVSWTLRYEINFYLVFFVTLFLKRRAAILAGVFAVVLAADAYMVHLETYRDQWTSTVPWFVRFVMAPWLLECLLGCFIAIITDRQRKYGGWALLCGVILLGATGVLNGAYFENDLVRPQYIGWRVALCGSAAGLLVYGMVAVERSGFSFPLRFSRETGGASYALYLCHDIFLRWTAWTGLTRWVVVEHSVPGWLAVLLFALLVQLFAVVHYRWLESKLYRWAKQLPQRI